MTTTMITKNVSQREDWETTTVTCIKCGASHTWSGLWSARMVWAKNHQKCKRTKKPKDTPTTSVDNMLVAELHKSRDVIAAYRHLVEGNRHMPNEFIGLSEHWLDDAVLRWHDNEIQNQLEDARAQLEADKDEIRRLESMRPFFSVKER